jgi:O-antigen ligase
MHAPGVAIALTVVTLFAAGARPMYRWCNHSPAGALMLLGGVWIIGEVVTLPVWQLAGLRITVYDLASSLVLFAAVARFTKERRSRVHLIWFVSISFYLLALARGLLRTDTDAVFEFSDHLVLLASLLYGTTFTLAELDWHPISTSVQRLAGGFLVVLLGKQMGLLGDTTGEGATLGSPGALVVALAFFAALLGPRPSTSSSLVARVVWMCVMGGGILILQHRTVWVAFACGLLLYALLSARSAVLVVAIALTSVALVVAMDTAGIRGTRTAYDGATLVSQLESATASRETFEWRTERWRATLDTNADRGLLAVVVGAGYRADWVENRPQADRREPPHSQYLEIAVRFGIVGLVTWAWLYVTSFRRLRNYRRSTKRSDSSLLTFFYIVLATQVVWSLSYSLTMIQPILLGLAIGATSAPLRSRKSENSVIAAA